MRRAEDLQLEMGGRCTCSGSSGKNDGCCHVAANHQLRASPEPAIAIAIAVAVAVTINDKLGLGNPTSSREKQTLSLTLSANVQAVRTDG